MLRGANLRQGAKAMNDAIEGIDGGGPTSLGTYFSVLSRQDCFFSSSHYLDTAGQNRGHSHLAHSGPVSSWQEDWVRFGSSPRLTFQHFLLAQPFHISFRQ